MHEDARKVRGGLEVGVLKTLLPYLWPPGEPATRWRVVLALSSLALAKALSVYVPILYKQAVDWLSGGKPAVLALPLGLIAAYGLVRVMSLIFGELRDLIFARVGQRAIRRAGLSVFRHLHELALRFHLERQTGGLSRAIERGVRGIQTLLTFMLFNVLPTLLEIGLVTAILWRLFDVRFAIVTFVTVALYIAHTIGVTTWRLKFRREMNEQDSRANTHAIDSLLNYETVKYFGNEAHEADRYDRALRRYESAAVRSQSSLAVLNVGQAVIISCGLTLVMYMAAKGIVAGTMSVGDFVLVNTYLLQLYQPLGFFGFVYREIKQALVDMESMFALLNVPREVDDVPDAKDLVCDGGEVVFDNVSFSYDGQRPILQGVSFRIPAGKTVAVVGPSGSGKSTMARLLFRFYDVTDGSIRIDGQDLRDVTQASLRRAIGIVPQDTVLFNDTLRYNIAYGRPTASLEEIQRAAALASLEEFIARLPEGYDALVGERGLKLSGGEKQRVAIARTILKNPPVMIFDEATSALDTHTERQIQQNLEDVSRGRTTLVIAHRLSTVVGAHAIVVLEQGRIVERGTHTELVGQNGPYAALWRRQQETGQLDTRMNGAVVA